MKQNRRFWSPCCLLVFCSRHKNPNIPSSAVTWRLIEKCVESVTRSSWVCTFPKLVIMSVLASNGTRGIEKKNASAAGAIRAESTPSSFQWSFKWIWQNGTSVTVSTAKKQLCSQGMKAPILLYPIHLIYSNQHIYPPPHPNFALNLRNRTANRGEQPCYLKATLQIASWAGVSSKLQRVNSLESWLSSKGRTTPPSSAFLVLLPRELRVRATAAIVRKLHRDFRRPSPPSKLLCGCGPMALHPARSKMEPHLASAFF